MHVEGWTTLGALLKVFPILETSKRLDRKDEIIYESRIVAKTLKGEIVGIGEAVCSDKEVVKKRDGTTYQRWDDEYAVKSMSITRATSKSLRIPLGWIMVLAGYDGTPAEEMDGVKNKDVKFGSGPARTSKKKPQSAVKNPIDNPPKGHENAVDAEITEKAGGKPNGEPEVMNMVPLHEKLYGTAKAMDQFIDSLKNPEVLDDKKALVQIKKFHKTDAIDDKELARFNEILGIK